MPSKRIEWIDFCRIFTAFCVIVRHCDRPYGYFPYIADLFNYRSLIFFFFLMAGYFTHAAQPGQWVDWTRTKRLLVPYVFWTLIALALLIPLQHAEQISVGDWSWCSWQLPLQEMGLLHWCYWDISNVPLWYLRTLIIISFFAPLIQRLPAKAMLGLILLCFAASDVLCWADAEAAASRRMTGVNWLPFRFYESVLAVGFFSAGLLIRRCADGERFTSFVRSYAWIAPTGSLILLPGVLFWGFYPPVQSSALVLLGVATTMSIGALVARYFPRACHWIAQWGPAAFFVYVTHFILLHWLRMLLTGDYSGHLTLLQTHLAPWGILVVSLALYKLFVRFCPGFMRVVALAPAEVVNHGSTQRE